MKTVRVPWIQCRADEALAERFEQSWRGRDFEILAYSEREAREWWNGLNEEEKGAALGARAEQKAEETLGLF